MEPNSNLSNSIRTCSEAISPVAVSHVQLIFLSNNHNQVLPVLDNLEDHEEIKSSTSGVFIEILGLSWQCGTLQATHRNSLKRSGKSRKLQAEFWLTAQLKIRISRFDIYDTAKCDAHPVCKRSTGSKLLLKSNGFINIALILAWIPHNGHYQSTRRKLPRTFLTRH